MKYGIIGVLILLGMCGYFVAYPPAWLIGIRAWIEPPAPLPAADVAPFTVPDGYVATVFARDIPGARVMIRDSKGAMLVSQTSSDKVVALPDLDGDGKADAVHVVLENIRGPHGLAIICPETGNSSADQDSCVLYVAEEVAVKSYAYDADTYTATYRDTLAVLPGGKGHVTRTIIPSLDGASLLVSIGSSCNVCIEENPLRATIQSLTLATKELTEYARGLRNTVFMAYGPDGRLWGTDMGRDWLGDDTPPDEVNVLTKDSNYGWPTCYGANVHDTDFDKNTYIRNPCMEPFETPPVIQIQAHSAPLGLAFIPETWPEDVRGDLLVALHGSWNRSEPVGYKVVRYDVTDTYLGEPIDFMTGFLKGDDIVGRPAGVLAERDAIYISDDRAGAVYRITSTR